LLIPLEKARAGDEAPAFAVEVVYLDRVAAWSEKGRARLELFAADMPISKSSLLVHHSPLFRLTAAPGSFRLAPYIRPISPVLQSASGAQVETEPVASAEQKAVSRLPRASRPTRNLPIRVAFPHFGPSIFLISELTSENQTPVLEFDFQRDRKRGER
jgi:hypothetical protein